MHHTHHKSNRSTFASKLGIVAATAGSAVGLGNLWRFPSTVADGGGAIFIFAYLVSILLLGIPLMMAEFMVGRASSSNALRAFSVLRPRSGWKGVGFMGLLACFLISGFYMVVCAWVLYYFWESINGNLMQVTNFVNEFATIQHEPGYLVLLTAVFCVLTLAIILLGVKQGIEKSAKWLMPILFLLLVGLAIRAVILPGASEGLKFLFKPDVSRVKNTIFIDAIGQAFFSLSLGMAIMITYGSYFKRNVNLPKTALQVSVVDSLVAILAGLVIFPSAFALASNIDTVQTELVQGGPGLLFITIPRLFQALPGASFWASAFFLLLGVAALTTSISLFESLTVFVQEEFKLPRTPSAFIVTVCVLILGVGASYSPWFFDKLDMLTANVLLPLGGMLTCIFVGWIIEKRQVEAEITNEGTLNYGEGFVQVYLFIVKYIAPIAIFAMFVYGFLPKK